MSSLVILVAAAAGGFTIAHWLKLPVIPLLILFGFLLSHSGLETDPDVLQNLLGLGLTFLVYSAGIALNPKRFTGKMKAVLWTAILQFITMAASGFGLAMLLGFEIRSALFIGGSLATSSTFVVIRQLQKRVGSLKSYGRLAIGVLLVQDLAIIIVIVLLLSSPGGWISVSKGIIALLSIGGLALLAQKKIFPVLIRREALDDEIMLLVLLATLFVFAGLAHFIGLPFIVGAFFAGFSLSSFPVNGVARSLLTSISSFFLAIFFTALGALTEIPDLITMLKAAAFVVLILILTPILVTAIAEWKGKLSSRNALTSGLLLAQTSEFSLILGLYGLHMEQIPSEVMSVIAIIAVVTMSITPLIASDGIARRLLDFHPVRLKLKTDTDLQDHVLILGLGSEGKWAIKPLLEAGHKIVVVDHDTVVIEHLEKSGVSCVRGDASDEKVLIRAGISQAKLVLISMPNVQEILRVLKLKLHPEVPVIVRVFEEQHAHEIEKNGAIPVLNSHAAADAFMDWFDMEILQAKEIT